jgi:hypothetical protein
MRRGWGMMAPERVEVRPASSIREREKPMNNPIERRARTRQVVEALRGMQPHQFLAVKAALFELVELMADRLDAIEGRDE